ncbi:hypothetical protein LAJ19_13955 (plasmid) [Deinococcus taeanensis]|uniref:hypothetical protein n=1 Tax=Deinococcus taeanensis TaxID=2737050 RepID=UPI001CDBAF04|nr:hypothetical protein [Deinococcus taeanensis]UBV44275.1 hypothetical protein LAJ19_13955 [Deinococcus taeanensis]
MSPPKIVQKRAGPRTHDVPGQLEWPAARVRRGAAFLSPIGVSPRTSFVTGTLVRNHGAFGTGPAVPVSLPASVHHLNRARDRTVLPGGRQVTRPDQPRGLQERPTTDVSPTAPERTPGWTRGPHPDEGTSVNPLRCAPVRPWHLQLAYDEDMLFHLLVRLRRLFRCASSHPHGPFLVPQVYGDRDDGRDVPAPHAPAAAWEALHPDPQWSQSHHEADRCRLDEAATRQAPRAYCAAVSDVVDLAGRMPAELTRLDLTGMLVAFPSGHGERPGEHGKRFRHTFCPDPHEQRDLVATPAGQGLARARQAELRMGRGAPQFKAQIQLSPQRRLLVMDGSRGHPGWRAPVKRGAARLYRRASS